MYEKLRNRLNPRNRSVALWLLWALFAWMLVVLPLFFSSSLAHTMLSQMGIAIIVCLSYNILFGQGGMLSFGHAVYSGLGAFLAIHTLNMAIAHPTWFLPVSLVPVAGGVFAALIAALLGWVTTKKAATPFAMITLGVGELVWAMSLMFPEFFGGEGGISSNRVIGAQPFGISFGPQIELYYLIAGYTFVCTWLMFALTKTPWGQMLNAVRDNAERVEFLGYSAQVVRYIAFVIAAFFAGISGGLAALHFEMVTSEVVSSARSGAYLLFTFLGGSTFFVGPMVGAVLMVFAFVFLSELTKAWLLYLGLLFVFMVIFAPKGLAGIIVQHLQMARFETKRWLWMGYVALVPPFLLMLLGAAALIEMLYHLQLQAAFHDEVRFLGLWLHTRELDTWVGSFGAMATGAGLFEWVRRSLQKDGWEAGQAQQKTTSFRDS